jgi:hypothetical protein
MSTEKKDESYSKIEVISFDEDESVNYEYGTIVKCDTGRDTDNRCQGTLIWEKNGDRCCECEQAYCEGCCFDDGEYDSDNDFRCGACLESRTGNSYFAK